MVALPPVGSPTDTREMVDHVAHHAALATNVGDTDDDWTEATLYPEFVNYGGEYATAGFRKVAGGLVLLKGLVKTATTISGISQGIFALPEGYWPSQWTRLVGACNYSTGSYLVHGTAITILYMGEVSLVWPPGTAAGQWYSLDGLLFPCGDYSEWLP